MLLHGHVANIDNGKQPRFINNDCISSASWKNNAMIIASSTLYSTYKYSRIHHIHAIASSLGHIEHWSFISLITVKAQRGIAEGE